MYDIETFIINDMKDKMTYKISMFNSFTDSIQNRKKPLSILASQISNHILFHAFLQGL